MRFPWTQTVFGILILFQNARYTWVCSFVLFQIATFVDTQQKWACSLSGSFSYVLLALLFGQASPAFWIYVHETTEERNLHPRDHPSSE